MLTTLALALSSFAPLPQHMSDADFLRKATYGNIAEVELSRYVMTQTQDPGVKTACRHMIRDHSAALLKIKRIAKAQGIQVPNELSDEDRKYLSELKTMYGRDLNRNFVAHEIQDHADDIDDFRTESKMGRNHTIKMFASATLPTLQMHAMMWNKLG